MSTAPSSRALSSPTPEQQELFAAWRTRGLELMPYFARMLFSLRVLNAPGLGTWAVDPYHRLYVDFDAVATQHSFEWNAESTLHECSHLFAQHFIARSEIPGGGTLASRFTDASPDFDAQAWGIATDLSINDDLTTSGCTTFAEDGMVPATLGLPEGGTPHEYYQRLRKMQQAKQSRPQQGNEPTTGEGQQFPSDAPNQEQGQDQSGGEGAEQSGQPAAPYAGCGSASGGPAWEGELAPDDDLDGLAPAVGQAEQQVIMIQTAAAIIDHVSKGRGQAPAGMIEIAHKTMEPSVVPWHAALGPLIRRGVNRRPGQDETDWTRRNRRRAGEMIATPEGPKRLILPGTSRPKPTIAFVRDTSSSMSITRDLAAVGREVDAVARRMGVRGKDLQVIDVDARIASEPVPYRDAASIAKIHGRGGTDMRVGIQAALDMSPRPSIIIVGTDGDTPWPAEAPRVPVVACIVAEGQFANRVKAKIPDWLPHVLVEPAKI